MDDLNIDKTSNSFVGMSSPETQLGFKSFRKRSLFLFIILVTIGISGFEFLRPFTAVATISAISQINFQPPSPTGLSDEEILGQSDAAVLESHNQNLVSENDPSYPNVTATDDAPVFDRTQILSDYKNRLSEPFHISDGLKQRVQFWFDVYTKYGLDERVIHSQKYPWIVLKVVDIAPIIYAETPSLRWLRNQKADKVVREEMRATQLRLLKIAHARHLDALGTEEQSLLSAIQSLPGKIQRNASVIASSLRIQTGQKEVFQEGLSISRQFLPQMEEIFKEQKLPAELTRIPLVESSFNDLATSKAGASGVWQFIGNTGKKFLMVNSNIDERRSPIKSTYAAALVLKEDYMILKHQWPLAVTAYNHGPAGVRQAAKTSHSFDLAKILTRYQSRSFSFASSNYYTEFLAALYAEKYQDEIFGSAVEDETNHTQVVRLSRKMRANELLGKIDMQVDDFLDLNPELKRAVQKNSSLPKGFKLHIPTDKKLSDPKIFVTAPVKKDEIAEN